MTDQIKSEWWGESSTQEEGTGYFLKNTCLFQYTARVENHWKKYDCFFSSVGPWNFPSGTWTFLIWFILGEATHFYSSVLITSLINLQSPFCWSPYGKSLYLHLVIHLFIHSVQQSVSQHHWAPTLCLRQR